MDNGHEPATKADLRELAQQLRAEFQHGFDDLKETLRDSQTELLKAFCNYARSNDERIAAAEQESSSVKKRLAILENRMTEMERRLNFPPST